MHTMGSSELEHWKQLNADFHEHWMHTAPIECIFDILASRETRFLCSFTSLLYFHLWFNYLPSSHLRMCRLPFTTCQVLHVGGTNLSIPKRKIVDKSFWLLYVLLDKTDDPYALQMPVFLRWNILLGVLIYIFKVSLCTRQRHWLIFLWNSSLLE